MRILLSWILSAVIIFLLSYILPGITVSGFMTALVVALVLGLVNAFIRPVFLLLTLPLNVLTLGLFTFVVNALLILLVAAIVPGFMVANFWWALLFSIILSLALSLVEKN